MKKCPENSQQPEVNFCEATINGERFIYTRGERSADCMLENKPNPQELSEKLHNELGLKDINFEVFCRDDAKFDKENKPHYYVLMHGWTANHHIFSDVDNDGTVVEKILAMDPLAVIITPDGNGFGKTNFNDELMQRKNRAQLDEKCTAEAYAHQMDFLVTDILGLDRKDVTLAGHSMGGRAAMYMGTMGYEDIVAIALAAFPSDEAKDKAMKFFNEKKGALQGMSREKKLYAWVYGALSGSIYVADTVKSMSTGISAISDRFFPDESNTAHKLKAVSAGVQVFAENTVEWAMKYIAPPVLGEIPGPSGKKVQEQLQEIHSPEFSSEKWPIVSQALAQLAKGADYQNWDKEWITLDKVRRLLIIGGNSDLLVDPKDLDANLSVMLVSSMAHFNRNLKMRPAISAATQVVATQVGGMSRLLNTLCETRAAETAVVGSGTKMVEGGHYAALYSATFVESLVSQRLKPKNSELYERALV